MPSQCPSCLLAITSMLFCAACPAVVEPEPMGDARRPHFDPVDSGLDASVLDATRSDSVSPDAARPDAVADRAQPVDRATPVDRAQPVDHALPDTSRADAGSDAALDAGHDATAEDATGEDGGLPLLRVEFDQYSGSDELYVDWTNPAGDICEDWCHAKTCDWGVYGVATIADDDCGSAATNWVEISNARVASGMYRAKAYGVFCDYTCAADEVRVYVAGTLRKRFIGAVDVDWEQFLCMPVANGAWDTANFDWPRDSCP